MELQFRPGPSYCLAALYGLLHLAAVAALVASALPLPAQLVLILALSVHATLLIRGALLITGRRLTAVDADAGGILLAFGDGRRVPVVINSIYCTSWLQVVQFRRQSAIDRRTFWLIVLPDTADADSRRRIRAWLLAVPVQHSTMPVQTCD